MTKYPNIETATLLWIESLKGVVATQKEFIRDYIFHTSGIAITAQKIAEKAGLNPEKAYVLGLLHDWGKIQREKETGISHVFVGYSKMMELGYDAVARVCLTHSFPIKDFDEKNYPAYSKKDLSFAKQFLSQTQYDDYDKLIQLCDIFFESTRRVSPQYRLKKIRERYGLDESQTRELELGAKQNKEYFDKLCGCDVFEIVNLDIL